MPPFSASNAMSSEQSTASERNLCPSAHKEPRTVLTELLGGHVCSERLSHGQPLSLYSASKRQSITMLCASHRKQVSITRIAIHDKRVRARSNTLSNTLSTLTVD